MAKPIGVQNGDLITLDSKHTTMGDLEIDLQTPLFGEFQDEERHEPDEIELSTESDDANGTSLFDRTLFTSATDCGLCYRVGHVPGYSPLGYVRWVGATHNTYEVSGYELFQQTYPSTLVKQIDTGFVKYRVSIPMYVTQVQWAVYNNRERLDNVNLFMYGAPVSMAALTLHRGQEVEILVSATEFTHVVLQFKIIDRDVKIDFPQDQRMLDLTLMDALGSVSLVTGSDVTRVSSGDVIHNLENNSVWKVTDHNFFRTNVGTVMGWTLTARLLQQDETLGTLPLLMSL